MRILYGVQGTGNGHISRARVMAQAFHDKGVEVDYLFSGRHSTPFFDMQLFGQYQKKRGVSFVTQNGCIRVFSTLKRNSLWSLKRDIQALDLSGYDLVISDFEPISAWAARLQGVVSIGINHQSALRYPVPKSGYSWYSELILNYFAPVDISLACHWHHFGFPILPPIVDVHSCKVEKTHQILVYLPFEQPQHIIELLAPFTEYQFIIYHGTLSSLGSPEHLIWRSFNCASFKQDLASSGGVISNAGFELPSEALTLGKKLLVKPLHGQFEQLSNMAALNLLGAADCMMELDTHVVRRWLHSAPADAINYPPLGDVLVNWIIAGNWSDIDALCQSVWQNITLPSTWRKKSA
ncbi:MJ1255/VC2487 family glycosyltransferase [uncultured Shewanella sp.]|uniref:MJ1255/VC2487 family glycosyltransferase n=1 Tax=uncultured Shewanella sp. TaxID=173975 RepID=UPI002602564A|nr:MJ1255/VC2487 family glycosyltransferase [uncultured Shewanella sp.]